MKRIPDWFARGDNGATIRKYGESYELCWWPQGASYALRATQRMRHTPHVRVMLKFARKYQIRLHVSVSGESPAAPPSRE